MTHPSHSHAVRILMCLYAVETAGLLTLVSIYKTSALDWMLLSTKTGAMLIGGGIALVGSGWLLIRQIRASDPLFGRALALASATNVLTLLTAFLLLETAVRMLARTTGQGTMVGPVALRPTWSELTAQSRRTLEGVARWGTWDASYFVPDSELGWTLGANRRSPDGLYFSSVEGIRSAGPNIRMADRTAAFRVALIGDSNAFSFEVPFEQSWGYHLERLLGEDVQVLNFGVDGYGIDQMYLRYERDVRSWKPAVVLIGFIGHDLMRTMAVYPFVSFRWPGYLVKPRFTIEQGELMLLNVPLPSTDEILGPSRIQQLPFIDYDLGYSSSDWNWRFDRGPLVLRLLTSVFPRSPPTDPRLSDEATVALNGRLLAQIVGSVQRDGAVPQLVFMGGSRDPLVEGTLSRARVSALNVADCLAGVPSDRTRVPSGHHYTGLANEAIARCTAPVVRLSLTNAAQSWRAPIASAVSHP